MFPKPELKITGKILSSRIALCSAGIRSSSPSVPASKNFSINLSSPSATSSTSISCASCTCARMLAGISVSFPLPFPAQLVGVSLHAHQIDDARQTSSRANRQLNRNHVPPKRVGQRFQHALGVGAVAIHAVHHDQPRRLVLFAIIPHPLGHDFHASHAIDHHDRRVHHGQHHLGLVHEHAEPGRVENIDLGAARRVAHSTTAAPVEIDILRAISSSSWSVVAEPSSTRPSRCVAPAVYSMADTSEVFPACPCPTIATLRMFAPE